ncbi:hypothetical protein TL16_g01811 [Triparma laevis f. inornata]|uniref:Uncharacterized protein n=1 Tax=Triparma laevis f. inornata TaxID=1714386 RepID=A0A9W7DSW9_9STRA|nr:hypothetical protein TL16_g01811 [Triparma laevis f. inornata]
MKDYLNSRQIILSPNSETSLLFPPLKLKCYTSLPTLNIETSDNLYVKSFETLEHVRTARERMKERKNREVRYCEERSYELGTRQLRSQFYFSSSFSLKIDATFVVT